MKNILYIVFPVLVVVGLSGCDTAGGADDDIFARGADAALASWVSAPSGDLTLSDPASALAWEVEFIDESNGSTVESFQIAISDGTNSGSISYSSFTANADGNQGVSGSISLNDIATAIGVTVASMSEEDEFTFAPTLTRGGVVYPVGNASQFLNAVADFTGTIAVETTALTGSSVKNEYITGDDTVFLEFANDFTTELLVNPTLAILSATGQVDYAVGAIGVKVDGDGDDSVYYAIVTPTAAAADTASVVVSAASAIATGFVMVNDTLDNVWIVDNAAPTQVFNNSFFSRDADMDTLGQQLNYVFSEELGSISILENFIGIDDDEDGVTDEADEGTTITIDLDGTNLNYLYEWTGSADGDVDITITVEDLATNELSLTTIQLRI